MDALVDAEHELVEMDALLLHAGQLVEEQVHQERLAAAHPTVHVQSLHHGRRPEGRRQARLGLGSPPHNLPREAFLDNSGRLAIK